MSTLTDLVPTPDTAHPDLERHADSIRATMGIRNSIKIMRPKRPYYQEDREREIVQDVRVLTLKTHYGLAPYVGRPFIYTWDSVSDDYLWVAGSADIVYIPTEHLNESGY